MSEQTRASDYRNWNAMVNTNRALVKQVDALHIENAELKLAVQAAIDYFTDGITSKEQYDAYLRFVDAAQPFFVVAMAAQEEASFLRRPYTQLAGTRKPIIGGTELTAEEQDDGNTD